MAILSIYQTEGMGYRGRAGSRGVVPWRWKQALHSSTRKGHVLGVMLCHSPEILNTLTSISPFLFYADQIIKFDHQLFNTLLFLSVWRFDDKKCGVNILFIFKLCFGYQIYSIQIVNLFTDDFFKKIVVLFLIKSTHSPPSSIPALILSFT